jgi:hypothetical protein
MDAETPSGAEAYGMPQGEYDRQMPLAQEALQALPEVRAEFYRYPDHRLLSALSQVAEDARTDRQQLNALEAEVQDLAARTGRAMPTMPAKPPPTTPAAIEQQREAWKQELTRYRDEFSHRYFGPNEALWTRIRAMPGWEPMTERAAKDTQALRQKSLWLQERRDELRKILEEPTLEDWRLDQGGNPINITKIEVEIEQTRIQLRQAQQANELGLQKALERHLESLQRTKSGEYMDGAKRRR